MTKNIQCFLRNGRRKNWAERPNANLSAHHYPNKDLERKILQNSVEMVSGCIQYNSAHLVVLWTLGPLFIARTINPFVQSHVLTQQPPGTRHFFRFNENCIFSKFKHQIS